MAVVVASAAMNLTAIAAPARGLGMRKLQGSSRKFGTNSR
jgi:hypothetical protein